MRVLMRPCLPELELREDYDGLLRNLGQITVSLACIVEQLSSKIGG